MYVCDTASIATGSVTLSRCVHGCLTSCPVMLSVLRQPSSAVTYWQAKSRGSLTSMLRGVDIAKCLLQSLNMWHRSEVTTNTSIMYIVSFSSVSTNHFHPRLPSPFRTDSMVSSPASFLLSISVYFLVFHFYWF